MLYWNILFLCCLLESKQGITASRGSTLWRTRLFTPRLRLLERTYLSACLMKLHQSYRGQYKTPSDDWVVLRQHHCSANLLNWVIWDKDYVYLLLGLHVHWLCVLWTNCGQTVKHHCGLGKELLLNKIYQIQFSPFTAMFSSNPTAA